MDALQSDEDDQETFLSVEATLEEENKILQEVDQEVKKEAEGVADKVFGVLNETMKKNKGADAIDQKVQNVLSKILEKARQTIMAAVAKRSVQKGLKRFNTMAEKEDQTMIDAMVENGEI